MGREIRAERRRGPRQSARATNASGMNAGCGGSARATRSSARVASPQGWSASVGVGSEAERATTTRRGSCAARVVRPSTSAGREARGRVAAVGRDPCLRVEHAGHVAANRDRVVAGRRHDVRAGPRQGRGRDPSTKQSAAVAPAVAWTPGRRASRGPRPRRRAGRGRVEHADRVRGVVARRAHRFRERAGAGGEGVGGGRHAWAPLALAPPQRGREAGGVRAGHGHGGVAYRVSRRPWSARAWLRQSCSRPTRPG